MFFGIRLFKKLGTGRHIWLSNALETDLGFAPLG
jgi:hypothetical protein